MADDRPQGRLELTWTNKHRRLLAHDDSKYEWVEPSDYRVSEVRLLHDVKSVGTTMPRLRRAEDNLLIRGDALSALTSLMELPEFSREYAGKIRLVYIDPPFNTGQTFDSYDDGLEHSVWLTMLRDRLEQIRGLLAADGSVWLHLDDVEVHRARSVLDEVFGEDRYMGTIIWRSSDNSNNDARTFSNDFNTLLVYARSSDWETIPEPAVPDRLPHYKNPDNDPRGPYFDGNPLNSPNPRENLMYDLVAPDGTVIPHPPNGWRWSRETLMARIETGEIRWRPDSPGVFRRTYLADHQGLPPSNLWTELDETGHNRQAKYELKRLFPGIPTASLFKTPKPERLIRRILRIATNPGDVVLDCFLGSGTTAAVAHKMGRRWIGVEWQPETVANYALPRLSRVVEGDDPGGITEAADWKGGGGFRVLDVAPTMFSAEGGRIYLADWAVDGPLAEATAAQLGFEHGVRPPFCGRKGRTQLAVIDGLVNDDVVRVLVGALDENERLVVCGTSIDPSARGTLREIRPGSTVRKIPASILDEYRLRRRSDLRDLLDWSEAIDAMDSTSSTGADS